MSNITLTLQEGSSYQGDYIYMPGGSDPLEVDLSTLQETTLMQLLWLGDCRYVFNLTISDIALIKEEICSRRG